MSVTVDRIYEEALLLPDESKAVLAEKLVDYIETHVDSDLERLHLDTVKRRRDEILSGRVQGIDGEDALARVRRIVNQ